MAPYLLLVQQSSFAVDRAAMSNECCMWKRLTMLQQLARRRAGLALLIMVPFLIVVLAVSGAGPFSTAGVRASGAPPTPTPTPFMCPGPWYHTYTPNPGGYANALRAVAATSPSDVWAVGDSQASLGDTTQTIILHRDQTGWTTSPSPTILGSLFAVSALNNHEAWAVGLNVGGAGSNGALIEQWDGASWHLAAPGAATTGDNYSLSSVAAVSHNDVWAVGHYLGERGFPQTLIEHWNGSTWSIVPSPNAGDGGELKAVSAWSANDAWAVGDFFSPGNGVRKTLTEHWDGAVWSVVPSPSPDMFTDDALLSVAARSSQEVWAVGYATPAAQRPLIERWDGATWQVVPSVSLPPEIHPSVLTSVANGPGNEVWAVGGHESGIAQLVERWDGSAWTAVAGLRDLEDETYLTGVVVLSAQYVWAVGFENSAASGAQRTLAQAYLPPLGQTGMGAGTQCPHPDL